MCSRSFSPRSRAFTVVDALIAFLVLSIGGISLAASLPTLARSAAMADENSKATQLAARMIEQLRLARFENLNYSTLRGLGLVDEWSGSGPYTFTNIAVDGSIGFSPAKALKNGKGEIEIRDVNVNLKTVVVRIRWTAASRASRIVELETAVGRY